MGMAKDRVTQMVSFQSKWSGEGVGRRNSSYKKDNTQVKANRNIEFTKHRDLKRGLTRCGNFTEGPK